jgi:hypothetical protein
MSMTVNSKDSARPAVQQEAALTTIALQEIVKIETQHDLEYYFGHQYQCIRQTPSYDAEKTAALLQIAKAENCDLAAAIATANLIQTPERK